MSSLPLTRRETLALATAPWLAPAASLAADGGARVLRYAFPVAETGFDPAQVSDLYSRIVTGHIFESPLAYDYLARPFKLKPNTAVALPEVSDDFRTFVFRLKPGIFFADDPAFRGKARELVADDYIYSLKRIYDPRFKSPGQNNLEDEGIAGLRELREAALKGKPFDYDTPVEGLQAIDRHTLRVRLRESRPRHLFIWASADTLGAVAREVVEAYGDRIMEHPVGTGPFRLVDWRRSSRMVLERNPRYRAVLYDAQPNADDADGQALLAKYKGRRVPMVDRVEIAVIDEQQPRWLAFLNGEQNFLERLPNDFSSLAIPGGKIAPSLAKRGISAYRVPIPDITLTVFNMEHAVIGGNTPENVALRRAIALANNIDREIRLARFSQAIPAQSMLQPLTLGYRADRHTETGTYDPARAKALLDVYGYVDRDGSGWRSRPDGSPLTLVLNTQPDQASRNLDELWKKDMDAIGVRVVLKNAQWPENLKAARSGAFMIWRVALSAASPDGQQALELAYGPSAGKQNLARFRLPAFDKVYDRLKFLPDGPDRDATFDEAVKLLSAYVPYRPSVHRIATDLAYHEVQGYRRPVFWQDWWQYVDVGPSVPPG